MHSREYEDLVRLARIAMAHSRVTSDYAVAARLQALAQEYRERAAKLNGGELADINEE